jgi:hypothetical protein
MFFSNRGSNDVSQSPRDAQPTEREMEQALSEAVAEHARRLSPGIQDACQAILETHRGRPSHEIVPELRSAFAERWIDPGLADGFAGLIAAGVRVVLSPPAAAPAPAPLAPPYRLRSLSA